MFRTPALRTLVIGGLAALSLTTAAFGATEPTVKSVDVEVDMEAIDNSAAAAYWTAIADDLENAIVARITDQVADEGVKVKVDIEEVSLSSGFTDTLGLEDTRLVGDVIMTHDTDNGRFGAYKLTVDVNAARVLIPEGTDLVSLPADTRVYYDAMIKAFAEGVVERLK